MGCRLSRLPEVPVLAAVVGADDANDEIGVVLMQVTFGIHPANHSIIRLGNLAIGKACAAQRESRAFSRVDLFNRCF